MLRNTYDYSKEEIYNNKTFYRKEENMTNNYLLDFFSIYWRYKIVQ